MKFRPSRFLYISSLYVLAFLPASCDSRRDTVSCFPISQINVSINLNLPSYYRLQNIGGWSYIIDEPLSGSRGLIVVRIDKNEFKAYDRNAPHICPDTDTTLEVINDIKIRSPKDGAEWILRTGQPIQVASIPPKTYFSYYDPTTQILNIYN
ncbi:MAG: hypothetical protein FDW93_07255 [Bergeyella sp.]|nr:hypothetical protein [Bergeyella sp.]